MHFKVTLILVFISFMIKGVSPLWNQACGDSLLGALRPERDAYRVYHYELTLMPDVKKKTLSGVNRLYCNWQENSNFIQIDLQLPMRIDKVVVLGKEVSFQRISNSYFIDSRDFCKKGSSGMIEIFFSGKPKIAKHAPWDGGMVYSRDKRGRPWIGVAVQGEGASLFWPLKDHLSEEPDSMLIAIYAPKGLMAISNGKLVEITPFGKGNWFKWSVSYPINNYNVTLNIGDYVHFQEIYDGSAYSFPMHFYVLRGHESIAKAHFSQLSLMFQFFDSLVGPYPFVRDGYKLIETSYAGMEHQSGISYGNEFKSGYLGYDRSGLNLDFDFILLHETAHEYWGNMVSMEDRADMWIHEAFATYTEAMFVEWRYGKEAANRYVHSWRSDVLNDKPILGQRHCHNSGSIDMYYKGALMLHTLRNLIQDEQRWWALWRHLQETFRYSCTNTEDFTAAISLFLEKDYGWLFEQYLLFSEIPILSYHIRSEGHTTFMAYRWENVQRNFSLPVEMEVGGKVQWLYPSVGWKWLEMEMGSIPKWNENDSYFRIEYRNTLAN
jgi:aminopeptidase N